MHTKIPSPSPVPRRLVAAVFLLPFLAVSLFAQATGTVTGRVFDHATGRSLQGAIVSVVGGAGRDYTDPDGRFTVAAPAGTATVEVQYVGLDTLRQTVNVTAGETVTLNAALRSEVLELETYEVQEAARGQALAINQQRTASGILNIVSEETFGQMLDGNIGAALQRLPGISVDEDQDGSQGAFNIRGISGDFNSFQIDGNRAPTSGGSRSFDARQMAADGVANIEVIKAPTPDRDGDAIGGIVNVVSRTAFQRDGRSMKLKASAVLNEEPNKWGHAATFSFSDLYDVAGREKNLGLSFTVSHYKTDRYSLNADLDWIQVNPANNPQLNLGQFDLDRPIWFMEATHWEYDTRRTTTYGLNGSIDFRTDEHNSFYLRPLYSHFDRRGIKFETDIDVDTRFQDAAGGRKTYAELTPTYGRGTPGNGGSRGSMGWIGTDDERENDLYSLAFGGRHERNDSLLTYDLYYSRSKQSITSDLELNMLMEPDSPWMLWEYELTRPWTGEARINLLSGHDPRNLGLMTEGELIDETSVKTEDVHSARLDWERKFVRDAGVFTFKTGAKYRSSKPEFDQTTIVHTMDEDFPYDSVVESTNQVLFAKQKYWDVYPRRGLDLFRSNPGLFELAEEDTLADSNLEDYDAKEETSAAYLMGTYQFGKHTILGGMRYEKVDWSNTNKRASFLDGVPTVTSVKTGDSYGHWLPGLHFRHALSDNLILRESYNRSYGRPQLSELTMGRFVDEDGNIEDGNSDLQPAVSNNFDIQLEYYTRFGGLYSVGFFYKKVKDFTFTQVFDFDTIGADGMPIPADGGDFEYERPVNGTTAKNYGWELIARQRLHFLPGKLSGLSAALSATFTESEADYPNRTDREDLALEGFSDYIFTGSLEYAWGNFRARLDYRYRKDYIEGLGDDVESDEFYAAEERVDAELSYRLRKNLSIFANGTNLTDRPQVSYQGYGFFVEDTSYAGRKYTFGVEYSF